MSGPRCPQTHLVEALHDGRLGDAEAASVQRHLTTCAACRRWQQDLAAIRGMLRDPSASPTPLEHQRARAALLRAAAGPPRRRTVARPLWLVLAGVGVAATAIAGSGAWRGLLAPEPEPAPIQAVQKRDAAPASHAATGPVRSRAATTAPSEPMPEAVVPEAVVPEAPMPEAPAPEAPAPEPPSTAEPARDEAAPAAPMVELAPPIAAFRNKTGSTANPRPATRPGREVDRGRAVHVQFDAPSPEAAEPEVAHPTPAIPRAAAAPRAAVASPASRDFASAMQALGAGDFGSAARQFSAFLSAYPGDPRAEEVAYLIAIAHERAGRSEQARSAARRYLAAWPDGAYRSRAAKIAAIPGDE